MSASVFVCTGGRLCDVRPAVAEGSSASELCTWEAGDGDLGSSSTAGNCANNGCAAVVTGASAFLAASCAAIAGESVGTTAGPSTINGRATTERAAASAAGFVPRRIASFAVRSLFFAGAVAAGVRTGVEMARSAWLSVSDGAAVFAAVCGGARFCPFEAFFTAGRVASVFASGATGADCFSASTCANAGKPSAFPA